MSPFNAWVMLKGLETLVLRCEAQATTSEFLTRKLVGNVALEQVIYPFAEDHPQRDIAKVQMERGGTVIALVLKGGKQAAFKFLNSLRIVRISNNLGDAKSLVTHPATTTHQRLSANQRYALGISDGLVRISVGLEDQNDLLTDITAALSA